MTEQEAVIQRFFEEVWNKGNLEAVDGLLTADFEDHNRAPGVGRGPNAYKASVAMLRSAFPDLRFSLEQVLAEGDHVAIRLMRYGTHQGIFMGLQPTGKQVSFGGMTFFRIQDGKIAETWGISDIGGLMQQLGVGPGQPPSGVEQPKSPYSHVSILRPRDSKSITRLFGVTNFNKASKADTRGSFSFFVSLVPPGGGMPIHAHQKEDKAYYLIDGQWEIYDYDNNETYKAGPDTYVFVPMGLNYGFVNVGDQPGRLVLITTPGGPEVFFESLGQLIEDPGNPPQTPVGPPDFARAVQIAAKHNISFVPPR